MSHFYGTLQGHRGEATRCGSKDSGIQVTAASWEGAACVRVFVGPDGRDWCEVGLRPWQGRGVSRTLYRGPVDGSPADGMYSLQVAGHEAAYVDHETAYTHQYTAETCPGRPCSTTCDHRGVPPARE